MRAQPNVMIEFMRAMQEAAGVASQVLVTWRDPRWALIRDTLYNIKSFCVNKTIEKVIAG